jgi:hypothetical protein
MLDFDDQVLALCDDLWRSGERLLASQLSSPRSPVSEPSEHAKCS